MRRLAVPLAVMVVLAGACAHERRGAARPSGTGEARTDRRAPPGAEVGLASFYAHRFHGKRTASGARYDMHALTCAHPSAPFGTKLRVTSLENGRAVVVTVNDRGPFAEGRVVDVSLAAARALGMVERGLVKVRVERAVE